MSAAYDWHKYESVPFAVFMHSAVTGWIETARPYAPSEAWQKYDALDCDRKMLLNYGSIVAEKGEEVEA